MGIFKRVKGELTPHSNPTKKYHTIPRYLSSPVSSISNFPFCRTHIGLSPGVRRFDDKWSGGNSPRQTTWSRFCRSNFVWFLDSHLKLSAKIDDQHTHQKYHEWLFLGLKNRLESYEWRLCVCADVHCGTVHGDSAERCCCFCCATTINAKKLRWFAAIWGRYTSTYPSQLILF